MRQGFRIGTGGGVVGVAYVGQYCYQASPLQNPGIFSCLYEYKI